MLIYAALLSLQTGIQSQSEAPPHLSMSVPAKMVASWLWTDQEIKPGADDMLLVALRKRLTSLYADGNQHDDKLTLLAETSAQSPGETKKTYAWGYATYLAMHFDRSRPRDFKLLQALNASRSPASYEYLRMRFLATASMFGANDYMVRLGERLAIYKPQDFEVIEMLSRNMDTGIPEARRKVLDYSKKLIAIDPDRHEGYASMAEVSYLDWLDSSLRDVNAAREAIRWIDEILKHEHRPGRAKAIETVKRIRVRLVASLAPAQKGKPNLK